ncbi:MAG: metalloregulator ArsR/SmtB family transcription factor [Planctomycetota bacterium]
MASITQSGIGSRPRPAASPKQAARRRSGVDRHLDTDLFKALADPTRALLLRCLIKCGRPCSVSEVSECCSVDFSVVARHLTTLARAGAVDAEKQGRTVWYRARCVELSARLRTLADAIDEWCPDGCCDDGDACRGGRCGCEAS